MIGINVKQVILLLLLTVFIQICLRATSDEESYFIRRHLKPTLEAKTKDFRVRYTQQTIKTTAKNALTYSGEEQYAGGVDPNKIVIICVVSTFEIWHGSVKLALPKVSYKDLAEVNALSAKPWKGGLKIHIKGSDAGGAYEELLILSKDDRTITVQQKGTDDPDSSFYSNSAKFSIPPAGKRKASK